MRTLLFDALERVLKEPQCARTWHCLMAAWLESRDEASRRSVRNTLEAQPESEANADILRLTFLAGATGESRYENAAAVRVLAAEPANPDRVAAFMAYQWLSALQELETRTDFVAHLSQRLVPEMALRQMQSAAQMLTPDFPPRVPDRIRRVAVVVPHAAHQFHTPSVMAIEQCGVLAREGCHVHIFSAQELMPPDAETFRGDHGRLLLPPLNPQALATILPDKVGMAVGDNRFSLPGRWRNLMPLLVDFDPDVVLLVGLYSPLAAALYAVRPIVGISVNTVPPIAPLDVWLTADRELAPRDIWGGIFSPPQPIFHPYRVRRSEKQWHLSRTQLGLGETAVVWITAGFRLEREIKGEWASRMLQLMAAYPDVVWLLVGGEGNLPQALQQAAPGRVRALQTRNDLNGLFRISDIYVNPPRMGGGLSVAEAMAEGLAVTSLADSDGGDKVGELALPGLDAYMERLAALTESPGLRAESGGALRKRFAERFDLAASGPALLAACEQAATLARARLRKPS